MFNRAYLPAVLELLTTGFDRARQSDVAAQVEQCDLVVAEPGDQLARVVHAGWIDFWTAWFGSLEVDPTQAGLGVARSLVEHLNISRQKPSRRGGAGWTWTWSFPKLKHSIKVA